MAKLLQEATTVIDIAKPIFSGYGLLGEELLNRIQPPKKREDLDWRSIAYKTFGWRAHDKQSQVLDAIFKEKKKVVIVRASKRGGKSETGITAAKVIHKTVRGARGWCASGTYDLAKRVYSPVNMALQSGEYGEVTSRSARELYVTLEGGGICQAKSWEDTKGLEGESLDYLIADEAQTLDEQRFNLLYARTMDKGGFMLLIGSPDYTDEYFLYLCERAKIEESWAYVEWTIWENPYVPREFILQAQLDMSEEAFAEIYGDQERGLLTRMPEGLVFSKEYHPDLNMFDEPLPTGRPLGLCIDPGTTSSAYAVGFVETRPDGQIQNIYLHDEIYEHNTYSEKMIEICQKHPLWPYVKYGVMDIAGRARHDTKGSPKEIWQQLAKIPIYDESVGIDSGIERHKSFLLQPSTGLRRLFIAKRCKETHLEYRSWRWPKRKPGQAQPTAPVNTFNHMLKAITYFIVRQFGYFDKDKTPKRKGRYLS